MVDTFQPRTIVGEPGSLWWSRVNRRDRLPPFIFLTPPFNGTMVFCWGYFHIFGTIEWVRVFHRMGLYTMDVTSLFVWQRSWLLWISMALRGDFPPISLLPVQSGSAALSVFRPKAPSAFKRAPSVVPMEKLNFIELVLAKKERDRSEKSWLLLTLFDL